MESHLDNTQSTANIFYSPRYDRQRVEEVNFSFYYTVPLRSVLSMLDGRNLEQYHFSLFFTVRSQMDSPARSYPATISISRAAKCPVFIVPNIPGRPKNAHIVMRYYRKRVELVTCRLMTLDQTEEYTGYN